MAKVNFKRVSTDEDTNNIEIEDGNIIITAEGTAYIDYGEKRIKLGIGDKNYVYFSTEEEWEE